MSKVKEDKLKQENAVEDFNHVICTRWSARALVLLT